MDSHLRVQRARDAVLGLDDGVEPDDRLTKWTQTARQYLEGPWKETLLSPFPGSRLSPHPSQS
jgi:hypothetical protein